MGKENTYKVNTLLKDVPDADLVTELKRRGYEVYKWEDVGEWENVDFDNSSTECVDNE